MITVELLGGPFDGEVLSIHENDTEIAIRMEYSKPSYLALYVPVPKTRHRLKLLKYVKESEYKESQDYGFRTNNRKGKK